MAGIELSEAAYEALANSGARTLLDENIETLLGMVFQKEPGTVGAIYDAAMDVIKEIVEQRPELFAEIKSYSDDQGMFFFAQLQMLMACYLRDEAMKQVETI